jgi:peptidoglycan hydrolase-like protein with peptidoglycan-binding domain
LQRDLAKVGVYSNSGPFTGYFGTLTKAAVIQLQRRYGAQPDGIVGNTTRELVERAMAEAEGIGYTGPSAAPQRSAQASIPQKDQIPEDLPALSGAPASSATNNLDANLPLSAYPSPTGYVRLKSDLTAYDAPNGTPINYAIATGQVIGYLEDKGDGWIKVEVPDKDGSWIFVEPDYSKIEFINAGATAPGASPTAETPASGGAIGGWKQDIESLLNRFRITPNTPQSTTPDATPEAAEPALDFGQSPDPATDYQAWRELTNSVDQLLARYYGAAKTSNNA